MKELPEWYWADDMNGEVADENSAWLQPMNWHVIFGGGQSGPMIQRDPGDMEAQKLIATVPQLVRACEYAVERLESLVNADLANPEDIDVLRLLTETLTLAGRKS